MKNKIILTFFLFLILIIGITTSSYAMFVIEDFTIDSELKDNGDLYVTERITYYTNENVNGLTRKIITKNPRNTKNSADSLELNYVKVDGEEYNYTKSGHIGESGIYEYTTKGTKEYNIKVYSPFINEIKVVEYSYVLENVGVKYKDTAELFWNFIGDEWDCSIENLQINITLPEEAAEGTIYVFGHGADNGTFVKNENYITLKAYNLSAYQPLDARILFPRKAIVFSNKIVNKNVLNKYINEEEGLYFKTEENKLLGNFSAKEISYIFITIVVCCILYVYFKYDKENKGEKYKYYREIPFDLEPELLQYFYYGKIPSNSYYIAVLNLIKLGVFKLKNSINKVGKEVQQLVYIENHNVNLKEYQKEIEKTIVKHMKKDDDGEMSIDILKLEIKLSNESGNGYTKYVKGLKEEKESLVGKPHKVPKKIKCLPIILLICLILIVVYLGIVTSKYEVLPSVFLMIMISAVYPVLFINVGNEIPILIFLLVHGGAFHGALCGFLISVGFGILYIAYLLVFIFIIYVWKVEKFSKEENNIIGKIKGLKNYINDYSMLEERESLDYINLWEDYFILAIALKINKKVVNYFYNYGKNQINSNLGSSMYTSDSYATFNYNMSKPFYSYSKSAHVSSGGSRSSSGSGFSGSSGGFSGGSSSGGRGGRRRRRKQILK